MKMSLPLLILVLLSLLALKFLLLVRLLLRLPDLEKYFVASKIIVIIAVAARIRLQTSYSCYSYYCCFNYLPKSEYSYYCYYYDYYFQNHITGSVAATVPNDENRSEYVTET